MQIHIKLIWLWDRIDELKIRSYHKHLASRTLRVARLVTSQGTMRGLSITLGVSWVLTTIAWQVGLWGQDVSRWHDNFPFIDVYVVNFVFDLLTLGLAIRGLKRIQRATAPRALAIGLVTVTIGASLAVASVGSMLVLHDTLDRHFRRFLEPVGFGSNCSCFISVYSLLPRDLTIAPGEVVRTERLPVPIKSVLKEATLAYWSVAARKEILFSGPVTHVDRFGREWSVKASVPAPKFDLLYGLTTLMPVAVLLIAMVTLGFAKAISLLFKGVVLRFLDRLTELEPGRPNSFMPGTRLSVLVGMLAVVAKAFAEIYR